MTFLSVYIATGGAVFALFFFFWLSTCHIALKRDRKPASFDLLRWALQSYIIALPIGYGLYEALKILAAICKGGS